MKFGNMSRLSKKPIAIPEGVSLLLDGETLKVKGPKGELSLRVLPFLDVKIEESSVSVSSGKSMKQAVINKGTMWSLICNAIEGVSKGFSKTLEINGVGFRAMMEGEALVLHLGFVNPIRFVPPPGVTVTVEKNIIRISGIDKESVGQAAAEIRANKKPEPYKGKGIKYSGEIIRRKAGKKAATAGS